MNKSKNVYYKHPSPDFMYNYDKTKMYSTKSEYINSGKLCSKIYREIYFYWGCKYCKTPIRRKDTSWPGHTHRNFYEDICDCMGARENGIPYKDIE